MDTRWWQDKHAPDFEVTALNNKQIRLSDYIGKKVIILNFFTTWCGPCRAELPELIAYYKKHEAENLVMIGINADEKKDLVDRFVAEQKISFPVGIDTNDVITAKYRVKSYPTTVFIGADGKVALYQIGQIDNADVVFESLFRLNQDIIKKGKGIDPAVYLQMPKAQPELSPKKEICKPKVVLQGDAKAFAARLKCPSCKKSLSDCSCCFCESVQQELSKMDVTNKTDEQILKQLFLESPVK
jgi:thiol-disulfide isomerase/thioredoxin